MACNGHSEETFYSNSIYRNAVAMCILQIDICSKNLVDDFKKIYSHIPWPDASGMRDYYGRFDLEKLWAVSTKDIPALKDYCETAIRQHEILPKQIVDEPEMEM